MLKRLKKLYKLLFLIFLISLSLSGFGLPIPLYEESRNGRRQIVNEFVLDEEEDMEEDTFKIH